MTHTCSCSDHDATALLDVREMAPRVRHPKIFETFDALGDGQSFVLVNDHDPKPLFYQFSAERANTFGWRYLEQGPDVWRVALTKRAATAPRATAADVVGEIGGRSPRAFEAMKQLGVNHCCGAHLTLAEAAAAAGIPLDALITAVNDVLAGEPAAR